MVAGIEMVGPEKLNLSCLSDTEPFNIYMIIFELVFSQLEQLLSLQSNTRAVVGSILWILTSVSEFWWGNTACDFLYKNANLTRRR